MPETFERFECGCEHPPGSSNECSNCEQCDNCCACRYCDACEEPRDADHMCSHCDYCDDCCECVFCDDCGGECRDEYCSRCDSCESCCSCECCDACGEPEEDCCCSPGTRGTAVGNYSSCPIRKLNWTAPFVIGSPRFGIEIEMSGYCPMSARYTNSLAYELSELGILSCDTQGYTIAAADSSLSGSSPAECKTVPLTVADHAVILYGSTLRDPDERRPAEETLGKCVLFSKMPQRQQLNLLTNQLASSGHQRWQRDSKTWSNSSAGMHVNVPVGKTPRYIWLRVMAWLLRGPRWSVEEFGGRSLSHYCHQLGSDSTMYHEGNHVTVTTKNLWPSVGLKRPRLKLGAPRQYPLGHRVTKHCAMSYRDWDGFEFRLFRSSTNPLRILGNCEMISVLLHHFENVPLSKAMFVTWSDIVRTVALHRHRYPYAADQIRRQNDSFSTHFDSIKETA